MVATPARMRPPEVKNYITPQGYARLKTELVRLLDVERPELVKVVAWAASNGDRSENGDYLYGKKRLREIDHRIHFLSGRLDSAQIVDPTSRGDSDLVFFGATVTYAYVNGGREERTIQIVGVDEVDTKRGHVSWISPDCARLLEEAQRRRCDARHPHRRPGNRDPEGSLPPAGVSTCRPVVAGRRFPLSSRAYEGIFPSV
jgi:transcription elongation factor GreB